LPFNLAAASAGNLQASAWKPAPLRPYPAQHNRLFASKAGCQVPSGGATGGQLPGSLKALTRGQQAGHLTTLAPEVNGLRY
jgi:hypothetical protein